MNELCECGAGIRREGDMVTIQPHNMGCKRLAEYIKTHPARGLEGEEALRVFDEAGSGWIREELSRL